MNVCLLIPHFNHERQFLAFLPKLLEAGYPAVIVDDGSDEVSFAQLSQGVAALDGVHLIRMPVNRGKGAAVISGFYHARALGYTHALQIDADGQHNVEDIPKLVSQGELSPDTIICGKPYFDASAPKARLYGRRVTDFWVALETLSLKIKDGLCGFRLYPLAQCEAVLDHYYVGPRMDFDTEILVKAVWLNIPLAFIPTKVIYPEHSVSHFHYLRDNLLLIRLHVRLMLGMLIRLPVIVMRRLGWVGRHG